MKIMTVALAAATIAVFATTTFTAATAAPRGERAVSNTRAGQIRPKTKRRGPRRCVPIYTRICQAGLPCRYVVTGHHCNRFN